MLVLIQHCSGKPWRVVFFMDLPVFRFDYIFVKSDLKKKIVYLVHVLFMLLYFQNL